MQVKVLLPVLALEQHDRVVVFDDGVVNLFAFLPGDVAIHFGDHLGRVEHIVAEQHYERHDEGVLGGLFCQYVVFHSSEPLGKLLELVFEIHVYIR